MTRNSLAQAKEGARGGKINPAMTRLKPERVMRPAKGTIKILAMTVTVEKSEK